MAKKWDIFISHASEDKRSAALPLAEALRQAGLRIWIDASEIQIGDSLRQRINEGLAKSRYGLVILSPNFLRKSWPKDELQALLAQEEAGEKVVIPVRYNISQQEITQNYPLIADRISLTLEDGQDYVVDQIIRLVGRPNIAEVTDIAIDFSHQQHQWNNLDSAINQSKQPFTKIERGILEQPDLIQDSRVLVIPPPRQMHFTKPEIDQIENWVDTGGGLFLMGYYDERHHSSNFSELAWRFDFNFRDDLLLPSPKSKENIGQLSQNARSQVFSRSSNYAVRVTINSQSPTHPILNQVQELAFLSSASIVLTSTEEQNWILRSPEDTYIMRPIGHIQSDGSRPAIDKWEPDQQGTVPILAARTWNQGRIVVSGTWKLWIVDYGDNRQLIENILQWLSGE